MRVWLIVTCHPDNVSQIKVTSIDTRFTLTAFSYTPFPHRKMSLMKREIYTN